MHSIERPGRLLLLDTISRDLIRLYSRDAHSKIQTESAHMSATVEQVHPAS